MATKSNSVSNEKKTRAIKQTSREDFVKVINDVIELVTAPDFIDTICDKSANGLYKFTTSLPSDMTGVKSFEVQGLKWYKVPCTDYRLSLTSYIQYRLTSETKARSNAIKQLADLSTEELLAMLANVKK